MGGQIMTIQITRPEVEALINNRLKTGAFKDAEDVVFQALQCSPQGQPLDPASAKNMVELFAPLRGLNIDFESDRKKDVVREIDL
jgi:hypothetical protein